MHTRIENEPLLDFQKIYNFMPSFVNNLDNGYFKLICKTGSELEYVINCLYPYKARDFLDALTYSDLKARVKTHLDLISILTVFPISGCKDKALFLKTLGGEFLNTVIRNDEALEQVENCLLDKSLIALLKQLLEDGGLENHPYTSTESLKAELLGELKRRFNRFPESPQAKAPSFFKDAKAFSLNECNENLDSLNHHQ